MKPSSNSRAQPTANAWGPFDFFLNWIQMTLILGATWKAVSDSLMSKRLLVEAARPIADLSYSIASMKTLFWQITETFLRFLTIARRMFRLQSQLKPWVNP